MNPFPATILSLALLAAPVGAPERTWTVDEVHQHAWELNGRIVDVQGWLPKCQGIDCTLFASKGDADGFLRATRKPLLLEIGSNSKFDLLVANKLPAHILLRAKVDATCIDPKDRTDRKGNRLILICVDRVNELQPIQLIKIQPAAEKSAKVGK